MKFRGRCPHSNEYSTVNIVEALFSRDSVPTASTLSGIHPRDKKCRLLGIEFAEPTLGLEPYWVFKLPHLEVTSAASELPAVPVCLLGPCSHFIQLTYIHSKSLSAWVELDSCLYPHG